MRKTSKTRSEGASEASSLLKFDQPFRNVILDIRENMTPWTPVDKKPELEIQGGSPITFNLQVADFQTQYIQLLYFVE